MSDAFAAVSTEKQIKTPTQAEPPEEVHHNSDAVLAFTAATATGENSLPKRARPEDQFPEGGETCFIFHSNTDILGSDEAVRLYQQALFREIARPPAPPRKQSGAAREN